MAAASGPPARSVFLGTSQFAAAVLDRLAGSPYRPALVVTRPDRPRGRGRRVTPPPVADAARALGIDLYQPKSVNDDDARSRIAAVRPDVICVCAFGALIKEPLLSDYDLLNVHPSLLPRWRGAAPIERAIMAGDAQTGVSIMRVTAGLDSGPICLQATEDIRPKDTYGTLSERLQSLGGELLVRALAERPPFREQDEAGATYAHKLEPDDRRLDPARPAAELERVVRALTPHVGAYVELPDGGRLGIREAAVGLDGPPACALSLAGPRPVLGCAEGALELVVVQPAGRRAMSGEDYLRGLR
ncbi:MAG TPA: methionyl-tRNA formyltransferase [Solirubrobacteraceae bacterium]|nr:methionyl-tRNA formyltransferase [Solirubrobacteraceae bacterium]